VVSVDTKKKELAGNDHNGGRQWRPAGEPARVKSHGFPGLELGKAIPYGICDLAAGTGWVNAGTGHDTAAFAVEPIRRWWDGAGRAAYPGARRLLITADAGGPDNPRTRAWKHELAAFALQSGLEITACHFPPGTSKWDKTGHRLFSHITMNWRGRPLTSHEVIVAAIAAATTGTGLRARAKPGTGSYPPGATISGEQMAALPLRRHGWHGDWNYTLYPQPPAAAPPPQPRPGRGERPGWAHPALTGMPAAEWDQLTTALALPYQAQREAGMHIARGGPATRRRAGGHPQALTPAGKTLVTILRQRLAVPKPVLAELFGVSTATIATAQRQITPLPERAGHTIKPATTPLTTPPGLTAYASAQGITLTPKTKPARQ
jgi:Rhodopirellula transposase DDE domain